MNSKKIEKNIKKNELKEKKVPKETSQEIMKKIFKNLIKAIVVMLYFVILNMAYVSMKQERLVGDIQVFAGVFLAIGIIFFEKAYKEDKGTHIITAIELTCLSFHSLSIMHVISILKYDFRLYLLTSSYIIAIYFVLKSIILYTKERKTYLESLSDISEIVKEEPIKKEATKKKNNEKANIEKISDKKEEPKKKKTKKEVKTDD